VAVFVVVDQVAVVVCGGATLFPNCATVAWMSGALPVVCCPSISGCPYLMLRFFAVGSSSVLFVCDVSSCLFVCYGVVVC